MTAFEMVLITVGIFFALPFFFAFLGVWFFKVFDWMGKLFR